MNRFVINIIDESNEAMLFLVIRLIKRAIPIEPRIKLKDRYKFEITSGENCKSLSKYRKGVWNKIPPYITDEVPLILPSTSDILKYGLALSKPITNLLKSKLRIIIKRHIPRTISSS